MNRLITTYLLIIPSIILSTYCSDNIVESVPSIDEKDGGLKILPKFSEIQEKIFTPSCATSGCHSSGGISPILEDNSYQNIVNKTSSPGIDYIEKQSNGSSF